MHLEDDTLLWSSNASIYELEIYDECDKNVIQSWVEKSFDLGNGSLYRFGAFKVAPDCYDFVMFFHHALIDGNSFDELIEQISYHYNQTFLSERALKKTKK